MKNYITNYDPFFNSFFFEKNNSFNQMLKTDIKEKNNEYLMKINVPDVKKEDIKIEFKNGYLTINVVTSKEENNEGEYLYHERETGEFSRTYYLGTNIKSEDIEAKLDNGVLNLNIHKDTKKDENSIIEIK